MRSQHRVGAGPSRSTRSAARTAGRCCNRFSPYQEDNIKIGKVHKTMRLDRKFLRKNYYRTNGRWLCLSSASSSSSDSFILGLAGSTGKSLHCLLSSETDNIPHNATSSALG